MNKSRFTYSLEKQGYKVTEMTLGGGFVNDVKLVTAKKGDLVLEFVLKRYAH